MELPTDHYTIRRIHSPGTGTLLIIRPAGRDLGFPYYWDPCPDRSYDDWEIAVLYSDFGDLLTVSYKGQTVYETSDISELFLILSQLWIPED